MLTDEPLLFIYTLGCSGDTEIFNTSSVSIRLESRVGSIGVDFRRSRRGGVLAFRDKS